MTATQRSLSPDIPHVDSLQTHAGLQTRRMSNDRSVSGQLTPIPRPEWLPESVGCELRVADSASQEKT
jgi:hypothetical protein